MSLKIVETYWSWYNTALSVTEIRCLIECDTLLDLPGINSITGYKLTIGTVAHVIDTNSLYMMQSGGAWSVQAAGTDVYTRSQIDTMLAAKQDLLTFDPVPAANSDNPVKSGGVYSYCGAILKTGSKNLCPYNTLSASSAGLILNDQPINLQAGDYILSFSQTATTGSSSIRLLYDGTSIINFTINNDNTPDKTRFFTLSSPVNQYRIYTSVPNDYTDMMIRDAAIPDPSYQPYAPTNKVLYDMILAL